MFGDGASLYRLWVRKGEPFAFQVSGNPPVKHDGGNTVAHLTLTDEQAEDLACVVIEKGCEWDLIPHERQTAEQSEERQILLGVQQGDRVWPSATCPTCAWFDPLLSDDPCGKAGWVPEMVASFGDGSVAKTALTECPVPHVWSDRGGEVESG